MTTLREIGVAALVNIGLTILFLLSFVFLSLQPVNDRVYYPKLYIKGLRKGRPRATPRQLKPIEKYVNLELNQYTRLFDWVKSALRKTENDIIQHAGLDSAVYLRIFLVGWVLNTLSWTSVSLSLSSSKHFRQLHSRAICDLISRGISSVKLLSADINSSIFSFVFPFLYF